jgi:hypothetical protein
MKFNFLLVLLMVFPGFIKCTSPTTIAGGASGTEVSGCIVDTAGIPLSGAIVKLRPANYLFDSLQHTDYDIRHSLLDTTTSSSGSFCFNNVMADSYCLVISLADSIAVSIYFSTNQSVSFVTLPKDTARDMSMVDGSVSIYGSDDSHSFVQIYGSEYKMQPDSNGYFYMKVPQGKHTLHIGAYTQPSPEEVAQTDCIDVIFDVKENYKNVGAFQLQPPPPYPCTNYSCDSAIVRRALDNMQLDSVSVNSVSLVRNGRIVGVSLRGIKIYRLSREIQSLTELTELDLGLTGITDVLPNIDEFEKLSILRLDSNDITFLPSRIVNIKGLKELNLSANKLNSFPTYMNKLTSIQFLDLSGNRLCNIDSTTAFWADTYDADWRTTQRCP